MIIDTKELIENSDLTALGTGQNIKKILKIREKILIFLKNERKTASEIERELKLNGRTVRSELLKMERKKLLEKEKGKKISNKGICPNYWITMNKIFPNKIVPRGVTCLTYKTHHHPNFEKNHYSFFPNKIKLDKNKLAAIGIFEAEGSKTKLESTEIVNCEPILINLFIDFLEYFKISKSNISFRIIFNKKILDKMDINKNKLEADAEKFWRNKINIPNELKIRVHYAGNSIGFIRKNPAMQGSLNINYNNVLFRKLRDLLISKIKIELREKEEILSYLRGFLAGEAYVGNHDREIQIASIRAEELDLLQELLKKIDIASSRSKKTSTSPPRVLITSLSNFIILEDYDIFKFHPDKRVALIQKILNYKNLDYKLRIRLENKLKRL
jgi:hypothetical protein